MSSEHVLLEVKIILASETTANGGFMIRFPEQQGDTYVEIQTTAVEELLKQRARDVGVSAGDIRTLGTMLDCAGERMFPGRLNS